MSIDDLVGPQEVAAELGVQVTTVHQWRRRGVMPPPLTTISRVPIWSRTQIWEWARERGSLAASYPSPPPRSESDLAKELGPGLGPDNSVDGDPGHLLESLHGLFGLDPKHTVHL